MFYLELFRALQDESVEYVVVGGIAINMHGIERATMDVDLVLAMTTENLQRFIETARKLDLRPVSPVPIESLCDLQQIDEWIRDKHMIAFGLHPIRATLPTVDIILRPKVPFNRIFHNRLEKDLGGVRLPIASIDDLIELKTGTGRRVDASDVEALKEVKRLGG